MCQRQGKSSNFGSMLEPLVLFLTLWKGAIFLPFVSFPEPAVFKNNRSSLSHAEFVEEAIQDLVESGRAVETDVSPRVVNPLSVSVQANGKKRLILDFRYVNKFLRKMHVKYENWKTAMSYFSRGAYMSSFDLKSGYHHVEIFEGH